MILDSSVIVALLLEEDGYERFRDKVDAVAVAAIGAPTLFETNLVMVRRLDLLGRSLVARFLEERDPVVIPFDDRHARVAEDAYVRYGKGRHPARLNYGDCMAYATAKLADLPLLFTGEDFSKTDLIAA